MHTPDFLSIYFQILWLNIIQWDNYIDNTSLQFLKFLMHLHEPYQNNMFGNILSRVLCQKTLHVYSLFTQHRRKYFSASRGDCLGYRVCQYSHGMPTER